MNDDLAALGPFLVHILGFTQKSAVTIVENTDP